MAFGKWLAGGLIGGILGAVVWVAIGYYLNAEVGYVAWGIGLLVGLGVRFAAASDGIDPSPMQGVLAAVIALAAILGAKYVVIDFAVNDALGGAMMEFDTNLDSSDMVLGIADEIIEEKEAAGQNVKWPPGMSYEEATSEEDYPKDIWASAEKKWSALSDEEKESQIAERQQSLKELQALIGEQLSGEAKKQAFMDSFTPFDLLWFGLALYTAFNVGYGNEDD